MKKKINAKQIVSDIRAGMDGPGLRLKYGLSDEGLKTIYRKLLDKGLVTASEIGRPSHPARVPRKPVGHPRQRALQGNAIPWRCPLCNADFPREFEECPKCGAIAAKVVPHGHLARDRPDRAYARYEDHPAAPANQWAVVAVSLAVFALVGAAIVAWSVYRSEVATGREPTGLTHASGGIKRFTLANFNREVVDASETHPVLIEFYADS
ncbi:MAG: hypothetical protein V1792_17905 [Pseudomonadota bacterium]